MSLDIPESRIINRMLLFGFLFYKSLFWPFDCGEIDHTDSGEPPHIRSENQSEMIGGHSWKGEQRCKEVSQ